MGLLRAVKYALRFMDPLYGRLDPSEHEARLIFAPEVQRLRYVRMCNINSLLIAGASEIKRFEHVLGVLRLTHEWIRSHPIPSVDAQALCAAAILHDVFTPPFGHSMQYVFEDDTPQEGFRHEDLAAGIASRFYQVLNANASFSGRAFETHKLLSPNMQERVANLIAGQGDLGMVLAGTLDLDNIDNVIRLAYHAGIAETEDADVALQLARSIRVANGRLTVTQSAIPLIERWQYLRRCLYEHLLLDWGDFSAKAMLTRMTEDGIRAGILSVDSWRLTDEEFLARLESESIGETQLTGQIARRLRSGLLYQPIALFRSDAVAAYSRLSQYSTKRSLEKKISDEIGTKRKMRVRLLVHFILDNAKTERGVQIKVEPHGQDLFLGTDSRQLLMGLFSSVPLNRARAERAAHAFARELAEMEAPVNAPLRDPLDLPETDIDSQPTLPW